MTLLQNLQLAWRQDTMVDFTVLQNASEDSRVNSVVALGQLYQRLAAAAPIPRITTGFTPVPRAIENSRPMMPTWGPPPVPPTARRSVPLEPEIRPPEKKSPAAKLSLFRRPKSDTAVPNRTSQEPIVPHYLLPAITADKSDPGWLLKEVEYRDKDVARVSMSSTEISSDASSSIFEPNDLWQNRRGISDGSIQDTATEASLSPISSRPRVPTSTLEVATSTPPRLTLPCEENKFAGFCKACTSIFLINQAR